MWIKFASDGKIFYRHHGKVSQDVVSIENLPSGRTQTKVSALVTEQDGKMTLSYSYAQESFSWEIESLSEACSFIAIYGN